MAEEKAVVEEKATVELSANAKKVMEMVEKMTVLELADLVKAMEEKFGVSASAPVAVVGAAPAEAAAVEEEKSSYDVELTEAGGNKIAVIKAVRELDSALGLLDAKNLVEAAPKVILEGAKKEAADAAKAKLEAAGAKVTLK